MHLLTCCANLSAPGSDIAFPEHRATTGAALFPLGALRMQQLSLLLKPGPTCLPGRPWDSQGAIVMCPLSQVAPEASEVSFRPFIQPEQAEA